MRYGLYMRDTFDSFQKWIQLLVWRLIEEEEGTFGNVAHITGKSSSRKKMFATLFGNQDNTIVEWNVFNTW